MGGGRGGRGEAVTAEADAANERRIAIEAIMLFVAVAVDCWIVDLRF